MNISQNKTKRFFAFILSVTMLFSFSICSFAEEADLKEALYQQYQKIVDKVNAETGNALPLSMKPYNEMKEEDWVSVEEFEKAAYALANADFVVSDGTSSLPTTRSSGSASKKVSSTMGQASFEVIINGSFTTQYNTAIGRQIFMSCDSVTSASNTKGFTWSQIEYFPDRLDSGRTYQINVSGSMTYLGLVQNHIFSVEFYCNSQGAIS